MPESKADARESSRSEAPARGPGIALTLDAEAADADEARVEMANVDGVVFTKGKTQRFDPAEARLLLESPFVKEAKA